MGGGRKRSLRYGVPNCDKDRYGCLLARWVVGRWHSGIFWGIRQRGAYQGDARPRSEIADEACSAWRISLVAMGRLGGGVQIRASTSATTVSKDGLLGDGRLGVAAARFPGNAGRPPPYQRATSQIPNRG